LVVEITVTKDYRFFMHWVAVRLNNRRLYSVLSMLAQNAPVVSQIPADRYQDMHI
jgi:hypothetical protein